MHLPRAMMEHLRAGLGAAALITTVAPAAGCAAADRPVAQAPFPGMDARSNPPAPIPVVQPIAQPIAQPIPVVQPVQPVTPPPEHWECGPCGMG